MRRAAGICWQRYSQPRVCYKIVKDLPVCDQYIKQAEAFEAKILSGKIDQAPLKDAIKNMCVIDALYRAGNTGQLEKI